MRAAVPIMESCKDLWRARTEIAGGGFVFIKYMQKDIDFAAASTCILRLKTTEKQLPVFRKKEAVMEYSIQQLSKLAGISSRTLRYYDEIGLLRPSRASDAGYRFYGARQVELLQQILFYREREVPLDKIKELIYREDFDRMEALQEHLDILLGKKERLEGLIDTVEKTIAAMKGEATMSDKERFIAFKQQAVAENESRYGGEIREKYGEEAVNASNRKLLDMSQEEYDRFAKLEQEIRERLRQAVLRGERPDGEEGRRIALLHREWLSFTWKCYTKEAHNGLASMYVADERFTAYYDGEVKGCAQFLADAIYAM